MKRLKHARSIWDYVKEFPALLLEILVVSDDELLFNLKEMFLLL